MTDQNPDREKLGEQDELYTPSVIEARTTYCNGLPSPAPESRPEARAEFDRMIARVRREAAAEQREKDAQIAADDRLYDESGYVDSVAALAPMVRREIAAAIREQGNDA